MAKVNKEGGNTDSMFAHQMKRGAGKVDTTKHTEVELGVEHSAGKRVFDFRLTACLNGRGSENGKFATIEQLLLPQDETRVLVSDADSQLLIKIFFEEKVNVNSVSFRSDEGPSKTLVEDPEDFQPPGNIKIFVNQPSLDFSDLDDDCQAQACAELKLSALGGSDEDEEAKKTRVTTDKVDLGGPKFQRVSSLQIFVVDAKEDAPFVFLNHLGISGVIASDYHTTY